VSGLQGRHVFVTGASTGIGRATAVLLAERGARVFLVARNEVALLEAAGAIGRAGGSAAHACADVADHVALSAAIDAAEAKFGPIDCLFANAGTGGKFAPLGAYDEQTFDTVIRTNLTSVFWAMKRVLPGMIERRRGSSLVTGMHCATSWGRACRWAGSGPPGSWPS
jgi:NAD(P)-dependent dehydrogenase (short-subunit alcohol dehydrogenase family)